MPDLTVSTPVDSFMQQTTMRGMRESLRIVSEQGGWVFREDFRNGGSGLSLLAAANAGGTANTTINPTVAEARDGIVQLRTGTTAAIDQRGGYTSNLTHLRPGNGNRYYFGCGLRTVTPFFDGTLTGFYQFGLTDVASSIGNGMIGFFSQDGGNWLCRSANGGSGTSFDTGIAITDTTWRDFAFVYYENGAKVEWFVDGVKVHTFWLTTGTNDALNTYSANINTTTNQAGVKAMIHRTSATGTQVAIDVDYIDFGVKNSTTVYDRFDTPMNAFKGA